MRTPPHERRRLPRCAGLQAPTTVLKHRPRPWSHCALHTAARRNGLRLTLRPLAAGVGRRSRLLWSFVQETTPPRALCPGQHTPRRRPARTFRDAPWVRLVRLGRRDVRGATPDGEAAGRRPKKLYALDGPDCPAPLRRRPPGLCLGRRAVLAQRQSSAWSVLRPPGGARAATVLGLSSAWSVLRPPGGARAATVVRLVCASAAGRCSCSDTGEGTALRQRGGVRSPPERPMPIRGPILFQV
jgi:hypothetical protein